MKIKKRRGESTQPCLSPISRLNHLVSFSLITTQLRTPSYLNFKSRQCRRFLKQLRKKKRQQLSENRKGRYQGEKFDARVCKYCNNVEDEEHFLLDCELYKDIRADH